MTNYTGTEARYPNQGKALTALREDRKISRSTIARACAASPHSIAVYEQGKRRPNKRNRLAIAAFYGVPPRALWGSKLGVDIANIDLALRVTSKPEPSLWQRLRALFNVGQA